MATRVSCYSPACPRECGFLSKEVPHIFQCHKGDETWYKILKVLTSWGEQDKAATSIIPSILHGITICRKGQPPQPPTYIPTPVDNALKKQTNIGWLQALMGLISHDCVEVQNTYLRLLGEKTSGVRWISALIRNLWNTAWGIWKFRNHTLHATNVPKKTKILPLINTRVSLHFNRGIPGLPLRCHFLF